MGDTQDRSAYFQDQLDRLRAGDESARGRLIEYACERLHQLARKMLRRYPALKRWEQTDDVLQRALLRLHLSLGKVSPSSADHFFGLAARHIRCELIDLCRHHFGPQGAARAHETNASPAPGGSGEQPRYDPADENHEPARLAEWAEFHEKVEALPEEERAVVNLCFYQGLTQAEAASVLGVALRTVKRRWQSAKLRLAPAAPGEPLEQR